MPNLSAPRPIRFAAALLAAVPAYAAEPPTATTMPATRPAETRPAAKLPGVVVAHVPASTGTYIGSPSLAVLPDGSYLASHDLFGPKSNEHVRATSRVYRSADRGKTWAKVAEVDGAFWSTLFVHRGDAYLLGTTAHHGDAVIRRSRDGGRTWSDPATPATGLLLKGKYHCAPVPVVEHDGRLWRGIEDASNGNEWGKRYSAMMLSAPVDADLLDAASWTKSNAVARDGAWAGGDFNAWLEGNAVVDPEGKMVDVLRVDLRPPPGKPKVDEPTTRPAADLVGQTAAIVRVSGDGKTATFDPAKDLIRFPGGATKFTIRRDPVSGLYWTLSNDVPEAYAGTARAASLRNTVALASSPDLRTWTVRAYVLHHPDAARHGFQYLDWQFDGSDLIALSRTAYDDDAGGARTFHDANYLTFHRIERFRELTTADSVRVERPARAKPGPTIEANDATVTGTGYVTARLVDGGKAFANRDYVWADVPAALSGWTVTQTAGGERATISVKVSKAGTLHVAAAGSGAGAALEGWEATGASFTYTDKGRTRMAVYRRAVEAGANVPIPQVGWAGTVVLLPSAK